MSGRPLSRWVDYSIEGAGGTFRVRYKDAAGEEHVVEFPTQTAARAYVEQFRRWPGDDPVPDPAA